MQNSLRHILLVTGCLLLTLAGCERSEPVDAKETQAGEPRETRTAWVDAERIINADSEPGNWLAHGRTFDEQRHSPLDQINVDTVGNLELAWYVDLDTSRGQEATPIVVDGIMQLQREFRFPDFAQAMVFTNRVGELAEAENHHPAILTEWGRVTVTWWSHKIRGLHRNDLILAARTDQAYAP